jgi:hypothetical protein
VHIEKGCIFSVCFLDLAVAFFFNSVDTYRYTTIAYLAAPNFFCIHLYSFGETLLSVCLVAASRQSLQYPA